MIKWKALPILLCLPLSAGAAEQTLALTTATGEAFKGTINVPEQTNTLWSYRLTNKSSVECEGGISMISGKQGSGTISCKDGRKGSFNWIVVKRSNNGGLYGGGRGTLEGVAFDIKMK